MEQKNLFKALANFQQSVPVIYKDTQAYGYKYADLVAVFQIINPLLKKNGLGFTQLINGNSIKTILFHVESGETIESDTNLPIETIVYETNDKGKVIIRGFEGMNKAQAIGSLITYFRRYALSSMLGLVTDKDTDGTNHEQPVKQTEKQTEKPLPFIKSDVFEKMLKATDILAIKEYCKKVQLTPEQAEQVKNHINTLK